MMELQKSPLHELCLKANGRMVEFSGWELPLQFQGLMYEHNAVRKQVGMFDISHMGAILLEGENPKEALQALVPTDLHRIGPGEACYSVFTNKEGGILDDLIIYDQGVSSGNNGRLMLVVNAGRTKSDLDWLRQHLNPENISISDPKGNGILIAIQGPEAQEKLESITGQSLKSIPRFGHCEINLKNLNANNTDPIFIAKTGYTGEEGFELLLNREIGCLLWSHLIDAGITPCGLGARDTLRLEAGMHLYGNEMNESITPFEAGLGWLVHLEMPFQFLGRTALEKQIEKGVDRCLIGLEIEGRGIARHDYPIFHQHKKIGTITSGSWSPTLGKAIAMGYVPKAFAEMNTMLEVEIRNQKKPARVSKKPFYVRHA